MIRGSEDTAERYKQDIFKYAKQKYGAEPDYPWVKSPESAVLRHKGQCEMVRFVNDSGENQFRAE